MKKQAEQIKERLQSVMKTGRQSGLEILLNVLKSDFYTLLTSYMTLEPDNLEIDITEPELGIFQLSVSAKTNRILEGGKMIPWEE